MKQISKLQTKVSLAIFSIALVLSVATVTASYIRYTDSFEWLYIDLATNVATTATKLVDAEEMLLLRNKTMEIYRQNPMPEFDSVEDYEAYLQQYVDLEAEIYHETRELLRTLKVNNNCAYLYIAYTDIETMSVVCLVNADDEDYACPTGVWSPVYPDVEHYVLTDSQVIPAFVSSTPEFGTLVSAGIPIVTNSGEIVAHMFIDISMNDVIQDRVHFMMLLISMITGLTACAIVVGSHWIAIMLVKPINSLAQATRDYIDQQEHGMNQDCSSLAMLDIRTGDEIEHLASSIQQMEGDINNYILSLAVITAERERIGAELHVATEIQANMLPSIFPAFPDREEFDLFATMTPAKEVGGDFYDFFLVDDDHLALIIADVSGKGVPAALFMVIAKTLLKNAVQIGLSPKDALERVNNQLCETNDAGMFVTVWLGVVEISTGQLTYSSAGHEYPALQRNGETFSLLKEKQGFVLAGLDDMKYKNYEIQLQAEDVLFLYTDGVTEATRKDDVLFGSDRAIEALRQANSKDPQEILNKLAEELDNFVGDAPQFDDITMLAIRYRPTVSRKHKET